MNHSSEYKPFPGCTIPANYNIQFIGDQSFGDNGKLLSFFIFSCMNSRLYQKRLRVYNVYIKCCHGVLADKCWSKEKASFTLLIFPQVFGFFHISFATHLDLIELKQKKHFHFFSLFFVEAYGLKGREKQKKIWGMRVVNILLLEESLCPYNGFLQISSKDHCKLTFYKEFYLILSLHIASEQAQETP